ncbi:hypothetical protein H8356DRAFT_1269522 [Neocallimastix lanati (nom. inval.)]|uniref:Uncharacterized protein n=1 Tax=Neocallimastix californiae TaxID=1754190 RepID=A0A1Y2ESA5_9FUNG|nr:hypothetical protein H8356DRAFT_1269522 [Neocallimastix sp. JGI-2020a]ORY74463.1 hypothetical protein LY90DRAFT_666263 [Neocallimastix californiae]|eukprot:ORY74463.1 hypothetical protein LY90DRAFT_666263 [Neocallimastix californiae]
MCETTYVEREIQTELSPLEQLDHNIGKINMEYDIAMKRQQEINKLTFEDRIVQYQKDCEKRIRKEIEDEFERYKDIELGKIRLEEKRKQELLITEHKKKLSDLDYEYTQKLREREIEERKVFLLKEQEFKHQLTKQQQKYNDEIERYLSKEDTLKREIEMNRRSQKLQEELIQKRLNDALKEIDRLKAQDIDSNKIIEEAKLRYKQEFDQKFNSKLKELDMEKKQLIHNQQDLNNKIKKISQIESKSKEIKNDKLIESQNLNEKRQLEYQEIIKTVINQSQKDLNKNKKQIQWKQECEELIKKLNNEINHSEELKKMCDDKTLRIKELERENADLSLLLHQTQSALQFSNTNKFSLYDNELNDQKIMYNEPLNYNKDLNDLKTSRNGSYSNYLTSINKLPDPWMSQTPSNNNNVLLNSSVLPPPFSYIDIDKKMKREIIMRQVQEKEEQNAKNGSGNGNGSSGSGSGNPINNLNYGINELTTLSQKYNLSKSDSININANGNSIKDDIIAGSSISNNSKISNKELLSVPSQKSSSSLMNSNNYLNVNSVKENKADSMSKHSDSGDIGKSISVCTLDIDSTELEIDLNQNSIKIDDSKIESTPHDPFEAQYKLLAQGGEDHIKELENRVLQGFESDDDIISIMSGERKNSLTNKDSSSKSVLKSNSLDINDINSINDDENKNEDNEENDDDDTEKEKPHNKWLKNKESINDSKSEINENEKTMKGNENFNLQSDINRILEKNKLNDVLMDKENKGEYSLNINLNKSINIDNLKGFEDTDESDEGEKEDNNKNKEVANNHSRSVTNLSNYENSSSKLSFKQEDMVFNWEDEYDKSKIENALKEINEKSDLDFSKLSLKTSSSIKTLSKKSLQTESSIKTFTDNFGEGNTAEDEFSAPSVNDDSMDAW